MTPQPHLSQSERVIHGDAAEVLPTLTDDSVDAVVTDPPFQLLTRTFDASDNVVQVSSIWPVAQELARVAKPGAVAAVFYDTRALPLALRAFERAGWTYLRHLTFYRRWGNAHQLHGWMSTSDFILIFCNGDKPTFYGPWKHDTYMRDQPELENTGHPFQKPHGPLVHIIKNVCPPGGLVLDPYAGSGSTLIAARDAGCSALGIERADNHAELIGRRLAA